MRLNQVTVPCLELDASIAFYRALGLELIVHSGPDYARFVCPEGGSTFSVHTVDTLPGKNGPVVYFECDELDRTVQRLTAQGLTFTAGPKDQRWLWREAYLEDPAGNVVCLYSAGDNRLNPPWRLRR
jgi:catechol 2,3-dioxygenase-like lactoylglutathione lyase family enzyme